MTDEIKRMNIAIDEDTRNKLELLSQQMKQSMSGVLRLLVIDEYERRIVSGVENIMKEQS